jgi:hypothetical protein
LRQAHHLCGWWHPPGGKHCLEEMLVLTAATRVLERNVVKA